MHFNYLEELQNNIIKNPANKENWLIYGDLLQTDSHPLGEVINTYCMNDYPVTSQFFHQLPYKLKKPFAEFMQVLISHRYVDHQDGTVTDVLTDLMWMRCYLGQTWNGSTCTGDASKITWSEASKNYGQGRKLSFKDKIQFEPDYEDTVCSSIVEYYHKNSSHFLDNYIHGSLKFRFTHYNDWRLPVLEEGTTLYLGKLNHQRWFYHDLFCQALPDQSRIEYSDEAWSASLEYRDDDEVRAWAMNFADRHAYAYLIDNDNIAYIRFVRNINFHNISNNLYAFESNKQV